MPRKKRTVLSTPQQNISSRKKKLVEQILIGIELSISVSSYECSEPKDAMDAIALLRKTNELGYHNLSFHAAKKLEEAVNEEHRKAKLHYEYEYNFKDKYLDFYNKIYEYTEEPTAPFSTEFEKVKFWIEQVQKTKLYRAGNSIIDAYENFDWNYQGRHNNSYRYSSTKEKVRAVFAKRNVSKAFEKAEIIAQEWGLTGKNYTYYNIKYQALEELKKYYDGSVQYVDEDISEDIVNLKKAFKSNDIFLFDSAIESIVEKFNELKNIPATVVGNQNNVKASLNNIKEQAPKILEAIKEGAKTEKEIASYFNSLNIKTRRGSDYKAYAIHRLIKKGQEEGLLPQNLPLQKRPNAGNRPSND